MFHLRRALARARRLARLASVVGAALVATSIALGAPGALFAKDGAPRPADQGLVSLTTTTSSASGGTELSSTTSTTTTTTTTTSTTEAANPCLQRRLALRCPDLVMSAPSELHLDRRTTRGRLLLRATSSVNSRGAGPIELRARRAAGHAWVVYQAIYDRSGRVHLFHTAVNVVYKHVPGDRYGFGHVEPASYWKIRHVAAFELWSVNATLGLEKLVRAGPKVDYCLRDLARTRATSDSPRSPVYPACSENVSITRDRFGTSVGWSDIYPYGYPEQWIDVTGLRGRFAFVQIANPDQLWSEASVANNASETFVALPSGRVLGTRTSVPAP